MNESQKRDNVIHKELQSFMTCKFVNNIIIEMATYSLKEGYDEYCLKNMQLRIPILVDSKSYYGSQPIEQMDFILNFKPQAYLVVEITTKYKNSQELRCAVFECGPARNFWCWMIFEQHDLLWEIIVCRLPRAPRLHIYFNEEFTHQVVKFIGDTCTSLNFKFNHQS